MRNRLQGPHEQPQRRAWADLPLWAKGLVVVVVVAIPLLALLLATVLFGVALAQDRQAQDAVLHTVEVERQIAQLQAMQDSEQRLLSVRQAQARRARTLALGAIGLSVLLGIAGGIAAVLLFTSGVTPPGGPAGAERRPAGRRASRCSRHCPTATPSASWGAAWSGPPCCSASASGRCGRPRPCWSTSSPGARW